MTRPRRSLLFMPGSNARALEKAKVLPADGIILDLEDSVAPDAKAIARDQIAAAMPSRATPLRSGATESSRSRIRPSAARFRAFSSARGLEPGMNRWLRRGRVMQAFLPVSSDLF